MKNVNVGDKVHIGHMKAGGSGYNGTIKKIDGNKVWVDIDNSKRTVIGSMKNVTKLEEKLLPQQILRLKKAYDSINKIDPSSEAYRKLISLLDALDKEELEQIVKANVKFVSKLAINRLNRMKKDD